MEALGGDARRLLRALAAPRPSSDRLLCATALAAFGVCADASRKLEARATDLLDAELARQILEDGGHVCRNPEAPLELLLDLLPLRQAYSARGRRPPERLPASISRMIAFLRMMQHGDGSLALFNGMGCAPPDRLATILAHDASSRPPPLDAPQSGYRRLEAGEAVVIVDAGPPPPPAFSGAAHAGCLSFEYSVGAERIVVNCGAPPASADASRRAARVTAAHSTLIVEDRSCCRIRERGGEERIVAGPREVRAARRATGSSRVLELAHDGYAAEFGLTHERVVSLTHDGAQLFGEDRIVAARAGAAARAFVLRFHLHPKARVAPLAEGRGALISCGSVHVAFEADARVAIEDSVFFAGAGGARKCAQLVVEGSGREDSRLRWSFTRVDERGEELVSAPRDI
ncbi:heparinase II/III family protein [Methylosinus sp. Sm6]|uniref:heparinase II/III family protein n=1 Tax=Methylosinus sp. Sm6 TaxID=2866948 RepID=UPI002104EBCA|nr:heparinase II/III family protein [Methylosinus sp. Sm6]